MYSFIDIHNHMLCDVDDGAKDLDESMQMLERAYNSGTKSVILTPHFNLSRNYSTLEKIKSEFLSLKEEASKKFPDLNLYLGNEIYYSIDVPELLEKSKILTLNDSGYILVEFGISKSFEFIKDSIFEINQLGLSPIIAHIERFECFKNNIEGVREIIKDGAYVQVNALSVLKKSRFIKKMLKYNLVHFIASDSHNLSSRPPELQDCFIYVNKKFGQQYASELFYRNAKKVIDNEFI